MNNHEKIINDFIKRNGYTYCVADVVEGYKKRKTGYYNSYTMNICLDNLSAHVEKILEKRCK